MFGARGRSGGFTLLEVLIAASIFFASIVVIAESYRVTLAAHKRSEAVVRMVTPVPLLMSRVENLLRENPQDLIEEEGTLLGVGYRLRASGLRTATPLERLDLDTDEFRTYEPRFKLYEVSISLAFDGQQKTFSYRELAWLPLVAQPAPAATR
jgi:hypothetical protein